MSIVLKSEGTYYILENGYRLENPYKTCAQLGQAQAWVYAQLEIAEDNFGHGLEMDPFYIDAPVEITAAYMEKAIIHRRSEVDRRFNNERYYCSQGYTFVDRAFFLDSTFLEDES